MHQYLKLLLLLLISILFSASRTLAQPVAPAPDASTKPVPEASEGGDSPEYRRLIGDALKEYGLEHFEESRSLFERAHMLSPSARTERGLGMVEFELRHYVTAQHLLELSLE